MRIAEIRALRTRNLPCDRLMGNVHLPFTGFLYVVKLSRKSRYSWVLKNSLARIETAEWRIFLMKDKECAILISMK